MDVNEIDREIYKGDPYEEVSRRIHNPKLQIEETVVLPRIYFDYFYWLIEIGVDSDWMISQCEEMRREQSLSEMLCHYLYQTRQMRSEKGLSAPPWLP
jgi:hypothetical protein